MIYCKSNSKGVAGYQLNCTRSLYSASLRMITPLLPIKHYGHFVPSYLWCDNCQYERDSKKLACTFVCVKSKNSQTQKLMNVAYTERNHNVVHIDHSCCFSAMAHTWVWYVPFLGNLINKGSISSCLSTRNYLSRPPTTPLIAILSRQTGYRLHAQIHEYE